MVNLFRAWPLPPVCRGYAGCGFVGWGPQRGYGQRAAFAQEVSGIFMDVAGCIS
ncbi:MAG: hypothetical protein WCK86_01530 [Planctomycetia bacterium]